MGLPLRSPQYICAKRGRRLLDIAMVADGLDKGEVVYIS